MAAFFPLVTCKNGSYCSNATYIATKCSHSLEENSCIVDLSRICKSNENKKTIYFFQIHDKCEKIDMCCEWSIWSECTAGTRRRYNNCPCSARQLLTSFNLQPSKPFGCLQSVSCGTTGSSSFDKKTIKAIVAGCFGGCALILVLIAKCCGCFEKKDESQYDQDSEVHIDESQIPSAIIIIHPDVSNPRYGDFVPNVETSAQENIPSKQDPPPYSQTNSL